jgi:hypothetical protein
MRRSRRYRAPDALPVTMKIDEADAFAYLIRGACAEFTRA